MPRQGAALDLSAPNNKGYVVALVFKGTCFSIANAVQQLVRYTSLLAELPKANGEPTQRRDARE